MRRVRGGARVSPAAVGLPPDVDAVLFDLDVLFSEPAGEPASRRSAVGSRQAPDARARESHHRSGGLPGGRAMAPSRAAVSLLGRLREAGVAVAGVARGRERASAAAAAEMLWRLDVLVGERGVAERGCGAPGADAPAEAPAGDLLDAVRRLGVDPERTAVVLRRQADLRAARRDRFGTVIGVGGEREREALLRAGADAVVSDPGQVSPARSRSPWRLVYGRYEPEREGHREALCTVGNGYLASRGAAPEAVADGVRYPGTYVAGAFNRLATGIAGERLEHESLVNMPNWLELRFRIDSGPWLTVDEMEVLDHRQDLDLRRGVLTRRLRLRDRQGRHTSILERRFASMVDPHLLALESTVTAEDWSGRLVIRSGLDGGVRNAGVARYRDLSSRHLLPPDLEAPDRETLALRTATTQSRIVIALAARTRLRSGPRPLDPERLVVREPEGIAHEIPVDLEQAASATVEKVVALYTSRDPAISEPGAQARRAVRSAGCFQALLETHRLRLRHLWERLAVDFDADERTRLILNLHIFHLLQTVSENTVDLDVGIPARGLHGEAYRGHVFWDELFVFPLFTLQLPELTRSLLRYRHRRLPEARRAAREAGHRGAMFPWQSGSDGREESQTLHLNPRSGRWLADNSRLQRHINVAIAYNVWQYQQATGDVEFMSFYGAPLLLEIARFCASLAEHDPARGRYVIRGVMGPDEYHDRYPWRATPGLDNNAYTNVMVVWVLCRALELLDRLPAERVATLREELDLGEEEVDRWLQISRRMLVPFHEEGIISQFEGYERLAELDWDRYRARYGDIQRLDRILEAEGDTPNRFRASKQADVLMLFFLLSAEVLEELFARLGYPWDADLIPRNVDYYMRRTSHGSTLSRVVHSWVLARADRPGSWELFSQALESDIGDVQGGTTAEGIHVGAMAGTVDLAIRCYAGIEPRDDALWLNPSLPREARRLRFSIRYRSHWGIRVQIADGRLRVTVPPSGAPPITISYRGERTVVRPGESFDRPLPRRSRR